MTHITDVIFGIVALGGALLAIFRPVVIVRWAKRAHPELPEDDETALGFTRAIGIGGLCVVIFLWVIIFRSFSN